MSFNSLHDTSHELLITPYLNGIKLVNPESVSSNIQSTAKSIFDLLQMPFNVCFINRVSEYQNCNEAAIESCGYDSLQSITGCTVFDMVEQPCAELAVSNDRKVMQQCKTLISDEYIARNDLIHFPHVIAIKIPWFGSENQILGILICAIVIGHQPTALALTQLLGIGFLPQSLFSKFEANDSNRIVINNVQLSPREEECLRLYSRGKTAKKVADILNLSRRTVEGYLDNIKTKTNIYSKSHLIELFLDLDR